MSLTIVTEESDDEVVAESKEVHGVAEEIRHPVVARNQRHEEELQDVEEDPERQESPDGNLGVGVSKVAREDGKWGDLRQNSTRIRVLLLQCRWQTGRRDLVFACREPARQEST